MHRNNDLYNFLLNKINQLTEDWYDSLNKDDDNGVYSSNNSEVIRKLKRQNNDFHKHLCKVFIEEEAKFFNSFEEWINEVAYDEEHVKTPINRIIREFFRVQDQYFHLIEEFISINEGEYNHSQIHSWHLVIIKAFSKVIEKFTEANNKAQQDTIRELSTPVISLNKNSALLPLIGDIDFDKSLLIERTLQKCAQNGIQTLYIDLSGVHTIDEESVYHLSQLIDALQLIGVKTILSGLQPKIAMAAIHLNLPLNKVTIKASLAQALDEEKAVNY